MNPEKVEKKALLNTSSAISFLYILHNFALELSGESKGILAGLMVNKLDERDRQEEVEWPGYYDPSSDFVGNYGRRLAEQLKGKDGSQVDVFNDRITGQNAILLSTIYRSCILMLPNNVRKECIGIIKLTSDGKIYQLTNRKDLIGVDGQQIKELCDQMIRLLDRPRK